MLLDRARSLLMVIDLQENLLPALSDGEGAAHNAGRLLHAAGRLGIPALLTEQYPKGLGHTVPTIRQAAAAAQVIEKTAFDATAEAVMTEALGALRRRQCVLAGAEAHVCVLQTALGLVGKGYEVAVCADAVATRAPAEREAALCRLRDNGVTVVTVEMVVFEWLGRAATPEFRDLLPVIK